MKKFTTRGFTLIEVLLVIAILAILAAVVIVAINPAKQLGEAQNAERRSDVRSILDALHQYSVDNYGMLPRFDEIPNSESCDGAADICADGISCDGVNFDSLTEEGKYLTSIPKDPTSDSDEITGYKVYLNPNGRAGVCAPAAYGGEVIHILR